MKRPTGARAGLVAVAAATLAGGLPATASADGAIIAMRGGVLEVIGTPAGDTFSVERTHDGYARVDVGFRPVVQTPDTCSLPSSFGTVACDAPTRVVARLGAGNDRTWAIDYPIELDLGPGDDEALSGAAGDTIIGGPGRDTVDYSDLVQGNARRGGSVTVTLNGLADDGEAGEGDNIDTSVEVIEGTGNGDHLVGDNGAQELLGHGGDDVLEGGGGNDVLEGSAGEDSLDGGPGDDRLTGHVDGDRITGGPGRDVIRGDSSCTVFACGYGADEIFARDGEIDDVECGVGPDRVVADREDLLGACETVELPPIAPTPAPIATKPSPANSGATGAPAPSSTVATDAKLRDALRRGIRAVVRCPSGCEASATARVDARTARRAGLGRRPVVVGRAATRRIDAGVASPLHVKLSSRAGKRLRGLRAVTVTVTVTSWGAGVSTTRSHRVRLAA